MGWTYHEGELGADDVCALLALHVAEMNAGSPPSACHVLAADALADPAIRFVTLRDEDGVLLGCGALKQLDPAHGEIKSMRTPKALRRRGAGRAILAHIVEEARRRGYRRLSLETGSQDGFRPAQKLYASEGFTYCGPFAEYTDDPNSVFMTLEL